MPRSRPRVEYDPSAPPPRTSALAWWSVGLGAVSLLPCLWIYFVPAGFGVFCGWVGWRQAVNRPKRVKGGGLCLFGMGLGILSIALGVMVLVLSATGVWQPISSTGG